MKIRWGNILLIAVTVGIGTVAAGKQADFVILSADPLADIANTRKIAKVYLQGQEINREKLRKGWN